MNALGALLTTIFAVIVFVAPRRIALMSIMAAVFYITQGQQVVMAGFHFTTIRLVLLVAVFRGVTRGAFKEMEINVIDKCIIFFVISSELIVAIGSGGASSEIVYQIGISYNIILAYFVFRSLVNTQSEVEDFLADLSILIIPFSILMMLEGYNGKNVFSSFGGVDTMYRDGHFRAEGAFRSPITAGTLGATLMPLYVGLYLASKRRFYAVLGMAASTVIVICSRSSGPLLAFGAGIVGLLFWRWREKMRTFRWLILISLVSLHLYMKAPVWFLMGHMSDIVGGGGWYRAVIVDQAVKHFHSWWLFGTQQTGDWMATQLADGAADLTNEFVAAGVRGGLLSLIIFIMVIVKSYRNLGLAMQKLRAVNDKEEMMLWALGAALFGSIVNFFSVSYFDQIQTIYYMLVAIISGLAFGILKKESSLEATETDGSQSMGEFVVESA